MAKITRVVKRDLWFLLLIAGIVSVPLFTDRLPAGSDLSASLSRIRTLADNLGKAFPMRIVPLPSADYGYSGASFQADLFYLFPAILCRLGLNVGSAYRCAVLLCHAAAAVTADICFEEIGGKRSAGLIGSMLFTWCPFRCSAVYLVGDLGKTVSWTFLPLILLGVKRFYGEEGKKGKGSGAFCPLAAGWSLTALSSTVTFSVISVMLALLFLLLGRESFRKRRLIEAGKVILTVAAVNAWFLGPLLMRLRDVSNVAPILAENFRGKGAFLLQYFTVFEWGGSGTEPVADGLKGALAVGPGACVDLIVLFCLWSMFVKKYQGNGGAGTEGTRRLLRKMLTAGFLLMLFSSNSFPWDLFQDRNLLFSVALAMLHTPAELGAAADLCLICSVCLFLGSLEEQTEREPFSRLLLAAALGSFCTTQFFLNNILFSHPFLRGEELDGAAGLPFALFTGSPALWRVCEAISVAAVIFLAGRYAVRRFRDEV